MKRSVMFLVFSLVAGAWLGSATRPATPLAGLFSTRVHAQATETPTTIAGIWALEAKWRGGGKFEKKIRWAEDQDLKNITLDDSQRSGLLKEFADWTRLTSAEVWDNKGKLAKANWVAVVKGTDVRMTDALITCKGALRSDGTIEGECDAGHIESGPWKAKRVPK